LTAFELRVKYGNTQHRWIRQTKVTLVGGTEKRNQIGSGDHLFEVSPGNVDLTIEIPPQGGLATAMSRIQQSLEILSETPFVRSVGRPYDERLLVTTPSAKSQPYIEIRVDNRFLDVTGYARKVLGTKKKDATPILQPYDAIVPTPVPGAKPPKPHWDNKLVLLEYTGRTSGSQVWMVLIPPVLQTPIVRSKVHNCLFFRPKANAYQNTDDVQSNIDRAARFFQDPPADDPFDARIKDNKPYRNCGFERQLAEANRSALFIYPLPVVGGFGDAATQIDLVDSIQALLIATGALHVVDRDSGLRSPHKLAVAAYSLGGTALFELLSKKRHQEKIDELYLFDPNKFGENMGTLQTWMELGSKRLRMIAGGIEQNNMIKLQQTLASNAGTLKGSTSFLKMDSPGYWQNDALYQSARSGIDEAAMRLEEAPGPATPGSVSDKSAIFIAGTSGLNVTFRGFPDNGDKPPDHTIQPCSNGEASGVINNPKDPVPRLASGVAFQKAMAKIQTVVTGGKPRVRPTELRHDWTVAGGEDSAGRTDRGTTFKGFLQLCLDASGLD
jgi:hypothetical protein